MSFQSSFSASLRGVFRPHPRGFGFVELSEPVSFEGSEVVSVFVPPPLTAGLLEGDLCDVEAVSRVDRFGGLKVSAEVVSVVFRPRRLLVGEVSALRPGVLVLRPDQRLSTSEWRLPKRFSSRVSAAGGLGGVVSIVERGDGVWVVSDLVAVCSLSSPVFARAAAAVLSLDPLPSPPEGLEGLVDVDLLRADAAAVASGADPVELPVGWVSVSSSAPRRRVSGVVFTVDSPSSRDLDDAISVAATDGGVRVSVHITDVASAVSPGSAVDRAAASRGSSVYLAAGVLPMLPRFLSEDRLSLLPGVERDVVSVSFTVPTSGPHRGGVLDVVAERCRLVVSDRLSYSFVEDLLAGRVSARSELEEAVRLASDAASALVSRRRRVEGLEVLFSSPRFSVDPVSLEVVEVSETPAAQTLVESLMVAANSAVASLLASAGYPALFRSHDGLDPELVSRLEGSSLELPGLSDCSISEARRVLDSLDVGSAVRSVFAQLVSASMLRADYRVSPDAHLALGSGLYTHFTSPLRRYADLLVHRVFAAFLDGSAAPYSEVELACFAEHLNRRAAAAARAESLELQMLWSLALARRAGSVFDARVVRIGKAGVSVRLDEFGVSGFVPASFLGSDWSASPDGMAGGSRRLRLHLGEVSRFKLVGTGESPVGRLVLAPAA